MTKNVFDKVLIANRGEIALRIMRTLRQMGIRSVAVYSEEDAKSPYVRYADEAYYIGHASATESYLKIDKILEAIRDTGAQAVHPGYGFLSENSSFARALDSEGVTLIGPSADIIKRMGDKIEAKKLASEAGVSTVPGYTGVIQDAKEAVKIASDIGFPVMMKAAAGGGGRGMRVIYTKEEVPDAFAAAKREAMNSFSDDRIFIEKFIEKPRHIEIQLLADLFGNIVCLGERECSIQRHHQKVIEEAPSPFVDPEMRQKMYDQVTALSKKVGYFSAGTVEFIVDANKNFYFLEMNTRLQVEHCVTELVTGVDIVEEMVMVAAGKALSFTQEDVKLNGWAIESRIYAEDPRRGFLPSSGRITHYREPMKSPHVRVDSGVEEGGEVSMFYDPMIAKLCTHADTRQEAITQMQHALGQFVIDGVSHNITFLEAIMGHNRFKSGDISTNFIAEEYPDGFQSAELTSEISQIFLCVALHIYLHDAHRSASIEANQLPGRECQIGTRWVVNIDGTRYPIIVKPRSNNSGYNIRYERARLTVRSNWMLGSRLFKGLVNDKMVSVKIDTTPGGYLLTHAGVTVPATVRSPRVAELEQFMPDPSEAGDSHKELQAPLSGKVVAVKVAAGDKVAAGAEVVIIEAMKMENIICAEAKGVVKSVNVGANDSIDVGQVMVEFE